MLDSLRVPFFIVAVVLITFAVFVEIGMPLALGGGLPNATPNFASVQPPSGHKPPGIAIFYLALLDGLVLFTVLLMGAPLLLPQSLHAKLQGTVTLIVSIVLLLSQITLIMLAFVSLVLMVTLLLAPIFGTIIYMILYAGFDTTGARVILSLLTALKLGFSVCLGLAHQRFLQNKGLVLIVITSLIANVIIVFLHGLVPSFLVSITDALAAIAVGLLAAIWTAFFLIGSIPSIFKVLRVDRAAT